MLLLHSTLFTNVLLLLLHVCHPHAPPVPHPAPVVPLHIMLLLRSSSLCDSFAALHHAPPSPLLITFRTSATLLTPRSSPLLCPAPSPIPPFPSPPVSPPPSQINNNMINFHSKNITINCRNSNKNMSEISSSFMNNLRQYHDQCHQYNIIEINKLDKNSHLNIASIFSNVLMIH